MVLLATLAATVLVLEGAVRLFSDVRTEPHPKDLYIADPDVGYRNNPGFRTDYYAAPVRFNAQSLRADREYGPPDSTTFRILLLGDSQTFNGAIPFEDTFGQVAQRLLNASGTGGAFEVLNAGVSGYGTVNEAAFLRKFGPELQPDLVIVNFYVNDVLENSGGIEQKTVRDGYLIGTGSQVTGNPVGLPYGLKRFLRLHSHLYHFVTFRWDLLKGRFYAPWKAVYYSDAPPEIEKDWEVTRALLADIRDWCAANGPDLLVAYIPQALQVENSLWAAMEDASGGYVRDLPNTTLREYCARENISFFDPYEAFREETGERALYGKVDKHLSIDGNHFYGELLFHYIKNNLLRGE